MRPAGPNQVIFFFSTLNCECVRPNHRYLQASPKLYTEGTTQQPASVINAESTIICVLLKRKTLRTRKPNAQKKGIQIKIQHEIETNDFNDLNTAFVV